MVGFLPSLDVWVVDPHILAEPFQARYSIFRQICQAPAMAPTGNADQDLERECRAGNVDRETSTGRVDC
ncbi:MAG TPA: hypothetical protein DCP40_04225 [Stenotrophomonas sp.]|nr:hypothetical protein [Stenotrophomonas sp.]